MKSVTFFKKLNLVQITVRNCPVARIWRQNTLRNCRFPSNWRLSLTCPENLAQLSCCLKLPSKHRAQLWFCLKLASKHSAQLTFFLKLAAFVLKLKFVQNTVCNRPFAYNWPFALKPVGKRPRNSKFKEIGVCGQQYPRNSNCGF